MALASGERDHLATELANAPSEAPPAASLGYDAMTTTSGSAPKQKTLADIVFGDAFRYAIMVLIVVNAIVIGLQTSERITAQWGDLLRVIDRTILFVFIGELALRLIADARRSVGSAWFWFDVFVVAVALAPLPGNLSVIRTLRVLRVLRLLSVSQKMQRVVAGLLNAIPGMATVMGVLAIVFYVFAVFATETFGDSDAEGAQEYFGTLGRSLFTLFQIMTLEDWRRRRAAIDGGTRLGLVLLRAVRHRDGLRRVEPLYRDHRRRDAG